MLSVAREHGVELTAEIDESPQMQRKPTAWGFVGQVTEHGRKDGSVSGWSRSWALS